MANILPNPHIKREQCVEQCKGCIRMFSDENIGDVCVSYVNPKIIHEHYGCALNSNKEITAEETKKTNPLKASRRKFKKG